MVGDMLRVRAANRCGRNHLRCLWGVVQAKRPSSIQKGREFASCPARTGQSQFPLAASSRTVHSLNSGIFAIGSRG